MFRFRVVQWLRHAKDDVVRALRSVVSPWIDFAAVQTTQTDIIKALGSQKANIADAHATIDALEQEMARLNVRLAEQDAMIRNLLARLDTASRKPTEGAEVAGLSGE